jgi:hypothetical protein
MQVQLDDDLGWIADHQDVLRRILSRSTGPLGELLVARKLEEEKGYKVGPARINAPQADLQVRTPSGAEFTVEVKTVSEKNVCWQVGSCPDKSFSQFWIFVFAPRESSGLPHEEHVRYFVLTASEAAELWLRPEQTHKRPDIRWQHVRDHENAWDKLPS